ncbi:MAG: SigB/SigF/SigG family RNA polymerase sigma factor [Christensenellaceae bacterium]|jgi:RNA polymerase sporulation-specific sigma factor|nr:SigB/SigF/SigG family RNA polymerase sigma factor [Christensenellaceae bacterium]
MGQHGQKKVAIVGVDTNLLPKFSNEKTNEILNKIKNGDAEARQQFIFANMRLVLSVIQRYIKQTNNNDDVFQVGCIGLIKAIDNFDPKFGVKFSTYAVPMIIGEIRRFLRDETGIRISRSIRDTAYRALQASEKLGKQLQREPTVEEIAAEIGNTVNAVFFALSATGTVFSLDEPIGEKDADSITIMEQMPIDSKTSDDWLSDKLLKDAIKNLAEKEREILLMRYFDGKTQMEISEEVGISQAQVSRLEKTALSQIKVNI